MIKNYLKTAWRSLTRGKSFSVINISGLAIGMAGAVLILLWLQNEISFDKFHTNKDRLFEVYGLTNNTDGHPSAIPVALREPSSARGGPPHHSLRGAGSDGDKGMAKAELFAQAANDFAVGDACFRGLDNPFEHVFALAVGGPCERVERAAHVA